MGVEIGAILGVGVSGDPKRQSRAVQVSGLT